MKPSPALKPYLGAKDVPWGTRFGKFEKIPVNRITNRYASDTVNDKSLPERRMTPIEFMTSYVHHSGFTTLGTGVHGDVYRLEGPNTKATLLKLHGILRNTVTNVQPRDIFPNMRIVIKVIGIPRHEAKHAWASSPDTAVEESFLNDLTEKTIRARPDKFKIHQNKFIPNNLVRQQHVGISENFKSKSPGFRKHSLVRHMEKTREKLWNDVLREGSSDAVNHLHLRKVAPVRIHTTRGTVTLDPKDVVPEFYFSGSSSEHGVYVIVMGVARGKTMKDGIQKSPELIAKLEKALLTLASVGVEHGDLHPGNIMIGDRNRVTLIDFGMTAILPAKYATDATKAITSAVNVLLLKKTWPEKNSNALWYGANNGIMRYMNSYMVDKHGRNFDWYNPTGKMLLHMKSFASKPDLDEARYRLWSGAVVARPSRDIAHDPPRISNTRRANSKQHTVQKKRRILNYGDL